MKSKKAYSQIHIAGGICAVAGGLIAIPFSQNGDYLYLFAGVTVFLVGVFLIFFNPDKK